MYYLSCELSLLQVEPMGQLEDSSACEGDGLPSLPLLLAIKLFDILLSLYIVGLIGYCLHLNTSLLSSQVSNSHSAIASTCE